MTLKVAEGLQTSLVGTNLEGVQEDRLFKAQKPYPNGVVVYTSSVWEGNGFGDSTAKVAVKNGEVVAVYENRRFHRVAYVLGIAGSVREDTGYMGHGNARRPYCIRTTLSKWIEAVKAL